jgi:ADP-ribose pyrophosphatase YjhB (NUDIX family)
MPAPVRLRLVRTAAPSFVVGAACVVRRDDGRLLLLRHSYRPGWGVPGGLLGRHEEPADAAVRETQEEVGLAVELLGPPSVVVDTQRRRVSIFFHARPAAGADPDDVHPMSAEIDEIGWWELDDLPPVYGDGRLILTAAGVLEPGSGTAGERRHRRPEPPRQ